MTTKAPTHQAARIAPPAVGTPAGLVEAVIIGDKVLDGRGERHKPGTRCRLSPSDFGRLERAGLVRRATAAASGPVPVGVASGDLKVIKII